MFPHKTLNSNALQITIIISLICTIHTIEQIRSNAQNHTIDPSKIPVNIHIYKPVEYFGNKTYVLTGINLTAEAEIGDEKFKNLTYKWSTKDAVINNDTSASKINFSFKQPDPDNYLKLQVTSANNETGSKQRDLVVRDPVIVSDPKGKLFLEQGELLQVEWKLTGTGPFKHCFKICLDGKRPDDCGSCSPVIETITEEMYILHYIRFVGNYTLQFVVDNIASRVEKRYSVRIIGTVRNEKVPYVPIISSIIAVLIPVSGFALHKKFKTTVNIETANFDFMRTYQEAEDEWFEELSFWERVRYVLLGAGPQDQESILNRSQLS